MTKIYSGIMGLVVGDALGVPPGRRFSVMRGARLQGNAAAKVSGITETEP